jgi:hypothetical protein
VRRGRRPHDRQGVLADDDRRGGTTTLTFTYANPAGAALASNVGAVDNLPSGWSSPIPRTSVAPVPTPRLPTIATPGGSTITTTNLQVPGGRIDLHGDGRRHQRRGPVQRELRGIAVGFTNGSGNLTLTNVIDAVTPSCVAVLGGSGRRDAGHPRADVARRRARAARLLVGFAGLRAMRPKENGRSRGRLRGDTNCADLAVDAQPGHRLAVELAGRRQALLGLEVAQRVSGRRTADAVDRQAVAVAVQRDCCILANAVVAVWNAVFDERLFASTLPCASVPSLPTYAPTPAPTSAPTGPPTTAPAAAPVPAPIAVAFCLPVIGCDSVVVGFASWWCPRRARRRRAQGQRDRAGDHGVLERSLHKSSKKGGFTAHAHSGDASDRDPSEDTLGNLPPGPVRGVGIG